MKQIFSRLRVWQIVRKAVVALAVVVIGPGLFALPTRAAQSGGHQKWAVLIGIAQYQDSAHSLQGPENDVPAMHELLTAKYRIRENHIRVLLNQAATRSGILEALDWLGRSVHSGDQVIIYYSGHGTRLPEAIPGSHPSGYDSALCPYETHDLSSLISSTEIGKKIDAIPTDDVTMIADCCNSGSASRDLDSRPRYFDLSSIDKAVAVAESLRIQNAGSSVDVSAADIFADNPKGKNKERYIGAARTREPARESDFLEGVISGDNPRMGALTYYLLAELRRDTKNQLTYEELVNRVAADLRRRYGPGAQVPQLHGPDVDSAFFLAERQTSGGSGGLSVTAAAEVTTAKGGQVTVHALAGTPLTAGSVLEASSTREWVMVEAPVADDGSVTAQTRAVIRLDRVRGNTAYGTILRGQVTPGSYLYELFHGGMTDVNAPLVVTIASDLTPAAKNALRSQVESLSYVRLVERGGAVTLDGDPVHDSVTIWRGTFPLPSCPVRELAGRLRSMQQTFALASLSNASPGTTIDLSVEDDHGLCEVRVGDARKLKVTADRDCYAMVVDIAADGAITCSESFRLDAGKPMFVSVKVTEPSGLDIVKAIATASPLKMPAPALSSDPAQISASILSSLQGEFNQRSAARRRGVEFGEVTSAGSSAIARDGWATADLFLRISPQK